MKAKTNEAVDAIGRGEAIAAQAIARFALADIAVIHRYGRMLPGEPIVQVMALSAHRQTAFDGAQMGPLISAKQLQTVLGYIAAGQAEGATLVTGGNQITDPERVRGNFIEPTLFAEVTPRMRIAQEEIFGPVLSVITFDDGKANALSFDAIDAVSAALTAATSDAKAAVLLGREGKFSAGFDLSVMTGSAEGAKGLLGAGAELGLHRGDPAGNLELGSRSYRRRHRNPRTEQHAAPAPVPIRSGLPVRSARTR